MTKSAELYACLYAREFPAQALLRLRPDLRDKPYVVMEGEQPLQEVCSLTQKARQLGIARGMTQVEVDTFAGVTVLQRSLKEETATQDILLECAGCFSPRIENGSYSGSFLSVLDIAGTTGLFGPPETLAHSLLARVNALGIIPSIVVSANFHTSIALAKGLVPRTVRVVSAGAERTTLASLPLRVLDLTEDQATTFALWGISTLGQLADLPERELISRMGQPAKHLCQLARGEASHLFQPVEPAFTLQERMELDSPVELLDGLMFVANLMLEQLILRATARVLALASITITLTLDRDAVHTRMVRPALPTNDRAVWLKLLHLDLEAHPLRAAVAAVALEAEPGSTSKVQLGLFSPQLPEASRLDVTLARIRAIVGEENVGRAILTDTHQIDGFRLEPFRISTVDPTEALSPPLRPAMRRIRPAETIFVTAQDNQPLTFTFRNHRYSIERAYGPWLVNGEWWRETLWGCEQWDLIAHAHDSYLLCCCVMRDLMRDQWQMVAIYD